MPPRWCGRGRAGRKGQRVMCRRADPLRGPASRVFWGYGGPTAGGALGAVIAGSAGAWRGAGWRGCVHARDGGCLNRGPLDRARFRATLRGCHARVMPACPGAPRTPTEPARRFGEREGLGHHRRRPTRAGRADEFVGAAPSRIGGAGRAGRGHAAASRVRARSSGPGPRSEPRGDSTVAPASAHAGGRARKSATRASASTSASSSARERLTATAPAVRAARPAAAPGTSQPGRGSRPRGPPARGAGPRAPPG